MIRKRNRRLYTLFSEAPTKARADAIVADLKGSGNQAFHEEFGGAYRIFVIMRKGNQS